MHRREGRASHPGETAWPASIGGIVAELSDPFPLGLEFPAYSRAGSHRASARLSRTACSALRTEPGPAPSPRPMACIWSGSREVAGTDAAARGGPKADRSSRDGRTRGGAARARTGAAAQPSRDPRRRPRGPVRQAGPWRRSHDPDESPHRPPATCLEVLIFCA